MAREIFEGAEVFNFPGLKPESYSEIKADQEEFPGYSTPIDELMTRFRTEGIKIALGKHPESGNVFVLPLGSDDIENDSLFPRHLYSEGNMDERLRELIDKNQKYKDSKS